MVAPAAAADTFCVNRAGCPDPGHNFTTIKGAIDAAKANNPSLPAVPSPDSILVGDGVFHEAVADGTDNPVDIEGSGPRTGSAGTLIERDPGDSVRTVSLGVAIGGRASTIRGMTIEVPSGKQNTGLLAPGNASDLAIVAATSPTPPTNSTGIRTNGNGATVVRDVTVDLPGTAIGVGLRLAKLESSSIKASTGISGDGTVYGTTIEANVGAQSSELKLEDCVLRISGPNAIALSAVEIGFNAFSRLTARHLTIVGDSDPTSLAVRVESAGSTSDNFAEADIRSSVLRGFGTNFKRYAVNSAEHTGRADLSVAYSNFDASIAAIDNGGPGTLDTATGNGSAEPGFRSAADLRLAPGSALIDAGDPASPDESGFKVDSPVDFDGLPRTVDGNGDGVARADIGAFEFRPEPPGPQPAPSLDTTAPTIKLTGKRVQRGAKLVKVRVTSDEAATVVGNGAVRVPVIRPGASASAAKPRRFKLKRQAKAIATGATTTLTLRLPKRAKLLAKRAQAAGRAARVTVTVQATDAAGNSATAKLRIKLKQRQR